MIAREFEVALQESAKPVLSRREQEVAALVAEGLTNREIAARLFISERTADGHLEHIREKLAVGNRAQVAAWFVAQSQDGAASAAAVSAPRVNKRRVDRVSFALAVATVVVLIGAALAVGQRLLEPVAPSGAIITTVAGSTKAFGGAFGGYSGDFGPATSAQLSQPADVAIGPTGLLYIADRGNSAIRRVDQRGIIRTIAGANTPIGPVTSLAFAPDGALYFADGGQITRVDPTDLSLQTVPTGPIRSAGAICFGPDGALYIADTFGDQVWRRSSDGTLSVVAGTGVHGFYGDDGAATGAQLRFPTRVALDSSGNLYITDTGNNRIRRVDASSQVITTVAGSSDTYGYGGDGGLANRAELSLPMGLAVAPNNDIYIADTGNNRVRRVDAKTHVITTVAGTGRDGFAGDEAAAAGADLYGPYAVAIDTAGDLYIADLGNHRIRAIPAAVAG